MKRIEIPTSVTSIGNSAFFGCSSVASVVIPDSVTSIGNATFQGCSWLTSVSLGKTLVSLGRDAFKGCSSLSSLRVESAIVERDCPYDKRDTDSFVSRYFPDQKKDRLEEVYIGGAETKIGNITFYGSGVMNVTIGQSVTSIGPAAFRSCTSLASVTIPNPNIKSVSGSRETKTDEAAL